MDKVEIYTDGACRGNPGPGGWAALLYCRGHEKSIMGAEQETTNNRMELTAAIMALEDLKRACSVTLVTDSKYLKQGITQWLQNWKKQNWLTSAKKPVKNIDLWQRLEAATKPHTIQWQWVKSHNGHLHNERVDQLANQAIDKLISTRSCHVI